MLFARVVHLTISRVEEVVVLLVVALLNHRATVNRVYTFEEVEGQES